MANENFDWTDGVVAILGRERKPAGAGFVVSADGLILTCAHVLDDAGWPYEAWDTPVTVHFKATGHSGQASVLQDCFQSVVDGDVALLALDGTLPEKASILPLCSTRDSLGEEVFSYGYPPDHPGGLYGGGEARGIVLHQGHQRLQIRSPEITKGFSGGPVWHPAWKRAIGVVVEGRTEPDRSGRLAYTMFVNPAETLVDMCDGLFLQSPESPPGPDVPWQLPERPEKWTGREKLVNSLINQLNPGVRITLIGIGGTGKTALTSEAIWRLEESGDLRRRFPDGLIWHTFYNRPQADQALEHIALSLGQEPRPTPADGARRALAGKQLLLVLDGAEAADRLADVLGVTGGCALLLTTRDQRQAVGQRRRLGSLGDEEAVALLKSWAGEYAADDDPVKAICDLVGYLPLAVRLVGKYLAEQSEPAGHYLRWLRESPLDAMDQGERREESVPLLIARSLEQVSHDARRAMGVAGILALDLFEEWHVSLALELEPGQMRRPLAELVNYGLLNRQSGRYSVAHPLVYSYVNRREPAGDKIVERLAAVYAYLVSRLVGQGAGGVARLEPERAHFMALLEELTTRERWEAAERLAGSVEDYLDRAGFWADRLRVNELGLKAAWGLEDKKQIGAWLGNLGLAYAAMGWVEEAIGYIQGALEIAREVGDRLREGTALGSLGNAYRDLERVDEAINHYQGALEIAREVGDRSREGSALGSLGNAYRNLGRVEEAIDHYQGALEIAREVGDRRGEGAQLGSLGNAYAALGRLEEAVDHYRQALEIATEIGDRRGEGTRLGNLGNAYAALGRLEEAIDYYRQALEIATEIGNLRGVGNLLGNLGNAYRNLGRVEEARDYLQQALEIFEEIKSPQAKKVRRQLNKLDESDGGSETLAQ